MTHKGKQIPLGTDEAEAQRQWHFLEASAQIQTAGDRNSFTVLSDAFLDEVKRNRKLKTYLVYRIYLEAFGKVHATLKVSDIKPYHLNEVLRLHPNWGKSTIRGFMVCISTTLNWGIKTGYTTTNPLHRRLTIPKVRSRGGDSSIPIGAEDYAILLAHANEPLRDFGGGLGGQARFRRVGQPFLERPDMVRQPRRHRRCPRLPSLVFLHPERPQRISLSRPLQPRK